MKAIHYLDPKRIAGRGKLKERKGWESTYDGPSAGRKRKVSLTKRKLGRGGEVRTES